MGARQSKRSVDITTGKEVIVEGGEVAASGGEGKLERIEDVDNLKPQLNGTAEHQEDVVISDKEKQMKEQDEAPENEKDNCNEKEIILSPVAAVNGESEQKESTESAETPESGKKQKKEKVKKKWSFRSISFSKKDKTKPTKKEDTTNGECEKVPEEAAADAQVVSNETPEAKEETEATSETTKVEETVEKPAEKTPETPVTEPITNGSSAPESPKEEVAQNGQVAEDQPAPVEAKEEAVPAEAPKSIECPDTPAVEALPVNGLKIEEIVEALPVIGLKIEETIEEIKEVVENKVDISEKIVTELVEAKAPEAVETEVCVEKETPEPVETVEAPPPLPVNPPPSSLTIFAEKTMAPHLVDTQVVGEMPTVDLAASLPSDLPSPVTDDSQQATIDDIAQPTSQNETSDNALVGEKVAEESEPVEVIVNSEQVAPSEPIVPVVNEIEISETAVETKIVENLAVVSSSEPEPISPVELEPKETVTPIEPEPQESIQKPKEPVVPLETEVKESIAPAEISMDPTEKCIVITECSIPATEAIIKNVNIAKELSAAQPKSDEIANISEQITEETSNLQITQCENIDIIPQISDDSISPPPPEPQSVPSEDSQSEDLPKELPLELTQSANVELSLSDIIPPPVNISESSLPQRTPSDPDVSETGFTEQSDSFPAPPPPVSCPESITEISASESLPPPPSESSQPDTVLNSPTSEISDFPPKDLPSPVKDGQHAESKDVKPEAVNSELPTAETQAPMPEETSAKVAESSVEEVSKVVSAKASQIKDIAEIAAVEIENDSIATQNCVVAAE